MTAEKGMVRATCRGLAVAAAVIAALGTSPSPGTPAAAQDPAISEPLRVIAIHTAPFALPALVDAIAAAGRDAEFAVRAGVSGSDAMLSMYNGGLAVQVLAVPPSLNRLVLFVYDGTWSAIEPGLEEWDRIAAGLCASRYVLGCDPVESRRSAGTRLPGIYDPPSLFRLRIQAKPGAGRSVTDVFVAYAEALGFAVRYEPGKRFRLYSDRFYVSGLVGPEEGGDTVFLDVTHGPLLPRAGDVPALADSLRRLVGSMTTLVATATEE